MTRLTVPFPAAVADDFLPGPLLEQVTSQAERHDAPEELHPSGYRFQRFIHADLIRYLLRFVKHDLASCMGQQYRWSSIYKVPQLYRTRGPWPGLGLHTDNEAGRDLAMIIYLSQGWRRDLGGQLRLHDADGDVREVIEPIRNRAAFLPLGPHSWHSVAPIAGEWERTTIIQDWEKQP